MKLSELPQDAIIEFSEWRNFAHVTEADTWPALFLPLMGSPWAL